MTTLVLPIEFEPGVELADQFRRMSDDEFFEFCQDNTGFNFERDASGNIIAMGQTGESLKYTAPTALSTSSTALTRQYRAKTSCPVSHWR